MSYVYFVQSVDGGLIKIGFAKNARRRLKDLQIGSPVKLKLLGFVSGTIFGEFMLHRRLSEHRRHGEWFAPHQEVLLAFAEAMSGSINLLVERPVTNSIERPVWVKKERDYGVVRKIGAAAIADALHEDIWTVRDWVWIGIPKTKKRRIAALYRKLGLSLPRKALRSAEWCFLDLGH